VLGGEYIQEQFLEPGRENGCQSYTDAKATVIDKGQPSAQKLFHLFLTIRDWVSGANSVPIRVCHLTERNHRPLLEGHLYIIRYISSGLSMLFAK
jgi:hypothetical protein